VPRFYFNFWDSRAFVPDPDGADLPGMAEVRRKAALTADELINQGHANREDRSGWVFEIKDEADRIVLKIPFREAAGERSQLPPEKPNLPVAGPHARPDLINPDATPGTGALPPIGPSDDPNMQSTS
jgi:hypothetical protein